MSNDTISEGERHALVLASWMRSGVSFEACMELAEKQVPCTRGPDQRDLVATLLLGHQWNASRAARNLQLLAVHAAAGRLGNSAEMVIDRLPHSGLPLTQFMARHPLTASLFFAGGAATAVLIDHGILEDCDVVGLLKSVLDSPYGADERHRLGSVSSHDEAFVHLAEISTDESPAARALLTAAMMRRRMAMHSHLGCNGSVAHATPAPAPARARRML